MSATGCPFYVHHYLQRQACPEQAVRVTSTTICNVKHVRSRLSVLRPPPSATSSMSGAGCPCYVHHHLQRQACPEQAVRVTSTTICNVKHVRNRLSVLRPPLSATSSMSGAGCPCYVHHYLQRQACPEQAVRVTSTTICNVKHVRSRLSVLRPPLSATSSMSGTGCPCYVHHYLQRQACPEQAVRVTSTTICNVKHVRNRLSVLRPPLSATSSMSGAGCPCYVHHYLQRQACPEQAVRVTSTTICNVKHVRNRLSVLRPPLSATSSMSGTGCPFYLGCP